MIDRRTFFRALSATLALGAALAVPAAGARNGQHRVPIAAGLSAARAADDVADTEFAFGPASARGAEIARGLPAATKD